MPNSKGENISSDNYFASNLKYLRKMNRTTQEEIARICGKSKPLVCLWEKKERDPDLIDVIKIADYFHITVDDLVNSDYRIYEFVKEANSDLENMIFDNVRAMSLEEQEKVLAMLDLIRK